MKRRIIKRIICFMAVVLCCALCSFGTAFANTDGTELQVAEASRLEIQLGPQWAGVEFQLKTDAGVYPGTITVGEDGVLRTEIGGSKTYLLSCLNSTIEAPLPTESSVPEENAVVESNPDAINTTTGELEEDKAEVVIDESAATGTEDMSEEEDTEETVIGGIPIKHIVLFGVGLVLAIGGLITISIIKKRRNSDRNSWDDEDDY